MDLMRVQIKTYIRINVTDALLKLCSFTGGGGNYVNCKANLAGKGMSTTNRDILLVQVHEHKYFSFYRKNGFQAMDLKY